MFHHAIILQNKELFEVNRFQIKHGMITFVAF